MIQRIQTVYLFIALIASSLLFFSIPVAIFQITTPVNVDMSFFITSKFQNVTTLPLMILNALVVGLSLAAILLYNKRILQLRVTMFAFLANVIFIIVLFFTADSLQNQLNIQAAYKFGVFMPLVSLVMLILASKAIKKDEKLVKGTDRLR
jgi:hypothetical protein